MLGCHFGDALDEIIRIDTLSRLLLTQTMVVFILRAIFAGFDHIGDYRTQAGLGRNRREPTYNFPIFRLVPYFCIDKVSSFAFIGGCSKYPAYISSICIKLGHLQFFVALAKKIYGHKG